MNWNPFARIRELEAEVVRLRPLLAVVERSHGVMVSESRSLENVVRLIEDDVEDWQQRWGEAVAERDAALADVETYARALRAVQEDAHERSLNVVTGEWP